LSAVVPPPVNRPEPGRTKAAGPAARRASHAARGRNPQAGPGPTARRPRRVRAGPGLAVSAGADSPRVAGY